jgi:fumarate hydratase class I
MRLCSGVALGTSISSPSSSSHLRPYAIPAEQPRRTDHPDLHQSAARRARRHERGTAAAETPHTQASQALNIILSNIDMAADDSGAICQDTGMPTFYVHTPVGVNQIAIAKAIRAAVAEATRLGKLRPNSVDSITGKNSGDNLGTETPVIHFEQWEEDEIEVKLILKGGGCENKNIQYSLPATLDHLGRADRNLEGVRKCLLHAVWQAQGQGCAPGALGVCIGSDRAHGYDLAKEQLVPHAGRRESRPRCWPNWKPRS